MDDLPFFVVARLFVPDLGIRPELLNIRTTKVLLRLLLSNLGGELRDDLCGGSFQGFHDAREILIEAVDSVFVEQGSGRSTALRFWCTSPGSEEGGDMDSRRNGSGLDLCLVVVQFESSDFRSSDGFSLRNVEGKESSEDGKDDPGEDSSVKGKNAKHKADELSDRPDLDRLSRARRPVAGTIDSGSGLGRRLTGPELFLNTGIWGRLSRSQGGFNRFRRLVINVMNVNRRKLIC